MRCRMPLVRGSILTGLQRLLVMVDAANGISAELPFVSWTFVPVPQFDVQTSAPFQQSESSSTTPGGRVQIVVT